MITVLIVFYLAFAFSLVLPIRRRGFREFGWFGGYSGGLVLGLAWPLLLRNALLSLMSTR